MPRIFNMPFGIIALVSVLFYLFGVVWYEFIFGDAWVTLTQSEEIAHLDVGQSHIVGFFLYSLQAFSIAYVLRNDDNPSVLTGMKVGFFLWLFIAFPLSAYAWNYAGATTKLMLIDAGCLFFAYLIGGAIYGKLKSV